MGNSRSKVPEYEIVDQNASTSEAAGPSLGHFSPPSRNPSQPSSSNAQQWAPVQQAPPPPLPHGWDFHIDPVSGYAYFYNTRTRVSQWQDPRGPGFSLPSRSNATNLGQRRQVIPPWEGGPTDADPRSWPLPPGWQEQVDQATNQRYYVNYNARIVSHNDPRLEIAKAYARGPIVEGIPVHYPPPVIGRPVDDRGGSSQQAQSSLPPQAGTSYLPPPPPLKRKRRSLWSKLGYRHGSGQSAGTMVHLPLFLVDPGNDASESSEGSDEEAGFGFPGAASSSSSSSSSLSSASDDAETASDPGDDDLDPGSDRGDMTFGESSFGNDGNGPASFVGAGGFQTDLTAIDEYGDAVGGDPGNTGATLGIGTGGGGGGVSATGGYQQNMFGLWQSYAGKSYRNYNEYQVQFRGSFTDGRFWKLGQYEQLVLVLTILVVAYCGVVEGIMSFVVAYSGRLIAQMCQKLRAVIRQKRKSSCMFGRNLQLAFSKKGSTFIQLKTAALSRRTMIQVWYYEHVCEHPVARVRVLTAKDGARPLHSELPAHLRDITIVTQASAHRLPAIEAMAKSWGGVMCVAIHVRTRTELKTVYPKLRSLHKRIESCSLCRLNICVVTEEGFQSDKEAISALYPINAMRNVALGMAKTDLVFILDADFVPSKGMHQSLTADEATYFKIWRMAVTDRQMLVVPAFEATAGKTEDLDISRIIYPTHMCELSEQWREGSAKPFHCSHFSRGHNPTDYANFFNQFSSTPYRVQYREFYEPYTICARKLIPRFDARFRGYGMNKISHAYHCASKGMGFSVLRHVFVWSLPHCRSEAWARTFGKDKDPLQKLRILGLYRQFKSEVRADSKEMNKRVIHHDFWELLEIKVDPALVAPRDLPCKR